MSKSIARHRAPRHLSPAALSRAAIRSGKPVAKASAILAVSGGLMATISGPSFASASDVSHPTVRSATADAAPAVARAGTMAPTFGEIDFTGVKASADQSASDLRRQSDAARASRSHERQAVADRAKELKRTKTAEANRQAAAERAKELERTKAAEANRQAAADRAKELKRTKAAEANRQAAATQQAERDHQAAATQQAEAPRAEAPKQESNPEPAPAPAPSHSGVLGIAAQYTGIMYVYGGTTPAGFDCSGYTSFVFAKVGINLPRTAAQQQNATIRVSSPRPGDLVFMGFPAHHVGIYAGGGMMYDSGRPGTPTQLRAVFYGSGPVSYGRV